jgi:hypothetical protein
VNGDSGVLIKSENFSINFICFAVKITVPRNFRGIENYGGLGKSLVQPSCMAVELIDH